MTCTYLLVRRALIIPRQTELLASETIHSPPPPQIRDFYLFTALKEGSAVTQQGGIQGSSTMAAARQWRHDPATFRKWARGETGFPFVDASMKELAATGWMSNRRVEGFYGRQAGD